MTVPELARLGAPDLDVGTAVRVVRAALAAQGLEAAQPEARSIVGHVLGLDLTGLVVGARAPVDAAAGARIEALARRRLAGEPVQRLIGSAGFFGLDLVLGPDTLVPRPDTETLVEAVLERFADEDRFVFADLGVGSGAILIAVLAARRSAYGVGTDLAAGALAVARRNAEANGVDGRAGLVRGSYAAMLAPAGFDAIVSNPPYVATDEIAGLDPEVRLHDPRLALDGGGDGLDAYRALIPQAWTALRPGGFFAVEIGWRQADAVGGLAAAAGLIEVAVRRDAAGRDRVVTARRPGHGAVGKMPPRTAPGK